MHQPLSATGERWIVCPRRNPAAKARLVCFPCAGGGASAFIGWRDRLPDDIEISAVQPPGREHRVNEQPYTRMEPLVTDIVRALSSRTDLPFVLFGHSLGALVAFEAARGLRRNHSRLPVHLIVSAHGAPHLPLGHRQRFDLPDEEFVAELKQINGTPEGVLENPELRALLVPLLRADFEVNETYSYSDDTPLELPITALGGLDDSSVPREALQAWEEHTSARFDLHLFRGGHFFLNTEFEAVLLILADVFRRVHRHRDQ